jgi:hypothetical protein
MVSVICFIKLYLYPRYLLQCTVHTGWVESWYQIQIFIKKWKIYIQQIFVNVLHHNTHISALLNPLLSYFLCSWIKKLCFFPFINNFVIHSICCLLFL